ncbi:hypothetical protein EGI15_09000 [Chryseobacterium cucumeris]|uniref:Zinc ribbon domain-containing protein n=1 Tax=Chryseobacterium cucumeris TaxID=1813611 RepID=A0ABX9X921_9FLAO|nr:zinc ribbon domain-containing protein [Chryseobacterium cucumeris]ROH92371.1 hypothetical protein EGI15_09000 [Chryseobacterium cucumeris]
MMEENMITQCPNCSKVLPPKKVYFCGGCMTQIRCKVCDDVLEVDDVGCTNCGTLRETKNSTISPGIVNANTFRLHETNSDRTIEATFSDSVGKDLAGILRDFSINNRSKTINATGFNIQQIDSNKSMYEENLKMIDADFSEQETAKINVEKEVKTEEMQSPQYLSLLAIAMKKLPASETEWIVVYSFFASNYGKDLFSKDDLLEKYKESNRLDDSKKSYLSRNITAAVKGGYLNPLATGYSILEDGVTKAKEIISRTSSSPVKKTSAKKSSTETGAGDETSTKKSSRGKKTLKRLNNIDFEPEGKESLKDYFSKYTTVSDSERTLLFINYMQNILEISPITFDHIFTCYDLLNLRVSENLQQTVRNSANTKGWFETTGGVMTLTIKGKNQIRDWNKN